MKKVVGLGSVMMLVLAACGGASVPPPEASPGASSGAGGLHPVAPSRNLHLRVAFDANPSVYVGRFVPAGLAQSELDENRAAKTTCSKFFSSRVEDVNQEMDELVYASSSAAASLGVAGAGAVGSAEGAASKGSVLRVHYVIKKKLQIDSDADQLKACCTRNPAECSSTVIGEFLMGSGEIYQATESTRDASGNLGVPPVAVKASVSDASRWKKVQSFNDTYFAFLPVAVGSAPPLDSCDFCARLPEDPNGLYFCGVSSPAVEETVGRDAAMQSARTQVVKYLGEQIEAKSQSLSTSARGLVSDQRFVEAVARGLAQRVKDKQYCSEKQNSPEHPSVYKVLAYVPNDALVEEASKVVDEIARTDAARVKPADALAAKEAIKKAATK